MGWESELQDIRCKYAGASSIVLGFQGAGGWSFPNVRPPVHLFHCAGIMLLHDVIGVASSIFDLEDPDETTSTIPYQMLSRLQQENIVKVLPKPDVPETAMEACEVASVWLRGGPWGDLSPGELRAFLGGNVASQSWQPEQRGMLRSFLGSTCDETLTYGLAQALEWPFCLSTGGDFSFLGARLEAHGKDLAAIRPNVLQIPMSRFSILVNSAGERADLLPETISIAQRVYGGPISVGEDATQLRLLRPADASRSFDCLDVLLSLRKHDVLVRLRALLGEWRAGLAVRRGQADARRKWTAELQRRIDLLRSDVTHVIGDLGEHHDVLGMAFEDPVTSIIAQEVHSAPCERPPMTQLEDWGQVPQLTSYRVYRVP